MRQLILTSLLISSCGGSVSKSGGIAKDAPKSIYQGLHEPRPSVLVTSQGLRIVEPYSQGVILQTNRQGQVILRGEVIGQDKGLAKVLEDMFDGE